ncbi:MAG: hypothetical protein ABJP45_10770 [Cyclobacteriaceae bacterium]
MRIFSLVIILITHTSVSVGQSIEERIDILPSLISQYPDSVYQLALKLKSDSEDKNHMNGIVQSNYILAYILDDVRGDYGKAIIYYLEAIRYAQKFNYEKKSKNLISLHKNCGVIFRKFKAFDLAEEYYKKGLEYAEAAADQKQTLSIKYNLSGVYFDQDRFSESINLLDEILDTSEVGSKKYYDILNRLGLSYQKSNMLDLSISTLNLLLEELPLANYKMRGYAFHNLARSYRSKTDFDKALLYYHKSLDEKRKVEGVNSALFETLCEIGETHFDMRNYNESDFRFSEAESLLSDIVKPVKYFQMYKNQANLFYSLGKYERSKYYEDLYSDAMNEYLRIQSEIRETDQRYNMDLITKRYFAEVDKQERIADILMYSKLTSGGLLTLLLLVIAYHRYQKIMLRRSIERELIALKIVD